MLVEAYDGRHSELFGKLLVLGALPRLLAPHHVLDPQRQLKRRVGRLTPHPQPAQCSKMGPSRSSITVCDGKGSDGVRSNIGGMMDQRWMAARCSNGSLCHSDGMRGFTGKVVCDFHRLGIQLIRFNQVINQTDSMGFISVDHFAGHHHLHGSTVSQQTTQSLSSTATRNQPEVDFWCSKVGSLLFLLQLIRSICQFPQVEFLVSTKTWTWK